MEVVVGTYEEFLLGYKLEKKNETEQFVQTFADRSHAGSLKCLAVQDHLVATGGTDDRIFIYDMRLRKQTQIILSHEGTVNALAFTPDNSHLLSGAEDGRMVATRLNSWITEGNWKAHNGSAITHISCHPSGKLALSLGADRVLCTWNLVKGRVAYKTNLKSRSNLGTHPDCLTWSQNGDYFTLCGPRTVEIWSIKTASVMHTRNTRGKPISVCWLANDVCLVGLESGEIQWINLEHENELVFNAHEARVKAMAIRDNSLVTISSTGEIKQWHIDIQREELKLNNVMNIGCRPTCLGILEVKSCGHHLDTDNQVFVEKPKVNSETKTNAQASQKGVVIIEYEEDIKNRKIDENSEQGKYVSNQSQEKLPLPRKSTPLKNVSKKIKIKK